MNYQPILSGGIFTKRATSAQTPSRLRQEIEEFNVESMLENLLVMEDSYFTITRDHMMATHLYMKDENIEILEEGFKDFLKSSVEFFANLLKKFKNFMTKVFMYFRSWFGSFDKFLDKYKDTLRDAHPDFTIHGFEFTFNPSIPQIDKVQNIVSDYNAELNGLKEQTKADIIKDREEFVSEDFLAKMRAYVIGVEGMVYADDFRDEARKVFRNGMKEDMEIKVDKTVLERAIADYHDLKKTFKEVSQQKDRIILLIESLKDFFDKSGTVHYKGRDTRVITTYNLRTNQNESGVVRGDSNQTEYSSDNLEKINTFFNFKWIQAKEIGHITVTAMTEKVQALKQAIKQHEIIIRKSIFNSKGPQSIEKQIEGGEIHV